MFSAALAILYAGTGKMLYLWDMAMEPRVVELGSDISNGM